MQRFNNLDSCSTRALPTKRTNRVTMTDEARVLRALRLTRNLSMRALGERMAKSDSYVSQIENGRMDIPKGAALDLYLDAIGEMTQKSFFDRVRRYRQERPKGDREEIFEIIQRLNDFQARHILVFARTLISGDLNVI